MTKIHSNIESCFKEEASKNISCELLSKTAGIFDKELQADASTTIKESVPINDASALNNTAVPDSEWLNEYAKRLLATSSPITLDYHKSEIENVNKIINSILSLAKWVSLATVGIVAIFVFYDKDTGAIISGVTGVIIDGILGILTGMFNSTLKSKKSYFDSESDLSKFNKMLLLVQTISDKSQKDSVIVDILHKHFNIHN